MSFIIDNNVLVTLSSPVLAGATSITVNKASAPMNNPPDPDGGLSVLTLTDSLRTPTKIEIITYTGRTDGGTTWTLTGVTKAQEGTTDQAWSAGDSVMQAVTKAAVARSAFANVDSVADIPGLAGAFDGQVLEIKGVHPDSNIGGGLAWWDAGRLKTEHNGGTIYSPTVPWDGTPAALPGYLAGAGETDAGGFGCWVRFVDRVSVTFWGAYTSNADACDAAIQAANNFVSASALSDLEFDGLSYNISEPIEIKSNVNYKGQGASLIISSAASFSIFRQVSSEVSNVLIDGFRFDGTLNYPGSSEVYKQTYTLGNEAVFIASSGASNVTIQNNRFTKLSGGSVDINSVGCDGISIRDNVFVEGSYMKSTILVRIPSGSFTDADRPRNLIISGNLIDTSGPQQHFDASKEDWTASADGIQVDRVRDAIISCNVVTKAAGIGIRVEDSVGVSVADNSVTGSGSDGIAIYKYCSSCSVTGNIIRDWGRIPFAYAMREYGGSYYIPRESPHASLATLPADPSASPWWVQWPYTLTGIDEDTIITYSASDYYAGPSDGILAFRGCSAISVTTASENVSCHSNVCIGNTTDVAGDYVYACEFGISPVHAVNEPADSSGEGSIISGNKIIDALTGSIYWPEYIDTNSSRGLLGRASFIGNDAPSSTIGNPYIRFDSGGLVLSGSSLLGEYKEQVAVLGITLGSGSATLDYSQVAVTKTGRLVTISGEIRVGSVSTPGGDVTLTGLPFLNSALAGRASIVNSRVTGSSFTGSPQGIISATLLAGSSQVVLYLEKDFVVTSLGAHLQVGTTIDLSFSYHAAE